MTEHEQWHLRDGTLCPSPVRDINAKRTRAKATIEVPCHRCSGQGGSEAWRHTGWTCYECGGRKVKQRDVVAYSAAQLAKLNGAKQAREARRGMSALTDALERFGPVGRCHEGLMATVAYRKTGGTAEKPWTLTILTTDLGPISTFEPCDLVVGDVARISFTIADIKLYNGAPQVRVRRLQLIDRFSRAA